MIIESWLAHKLSQTHISQWVDEGAGYHGELKCIIANASKYLQCKSSPAKSVKKILIQLKAFFDRSPVGGSISATHRRLAFSLKVPEMTDDGLTFSIIHGYINGRNGNIDIKIEKLLSISIHAIERLYQRISTTDSTEILNEIYDTLGHCEVLLKASQQVSATCWPLVSKRGFFVVVPSVGTGIGSLVTWMSFDQLSRKWGMVADSLRVIAETKPELLFDVEFFADFLRSFPWMLKPHRPATDNYSMVWQQNSTVNELGNAQLSCEQTILVDSTDMEIEQLELRDAEKHQNFRSIDFVPGLNYLDEPPLFKAHSRLDGVVVQVQRSGYCIVGLKNGWVGSISPSVLFRANKIQDGLGNLEIGDEVAVEIKKIVRTSDNSAYSLVLDLVVKVDAEWLLRVQQYPKGTIVDGVIFKVVDYCCYLQFADGAVAELINREFFWPGDEEFDAGIIAVGHTLKVKVIGVKESKRILSVSLRRVLKDFKDFEDIGDKAWQQIQTLYPVETTVVGKIEKFFSSGALVVLMDGVFGFIFGFLPMKELSWSREVKPLQMNQLCNQMLTLKVIGTNSYKKKLILSYRQCSVHPMDDPDLCPSVGDAYKGVVSKVVDYGFFITLPNDLVGLLHSSEVPNGFKYIAGQIIDIAIKEVDIAQRRLSLKLICPMDDADLNLKVGDESDVSSSFMPKSVESTIVPTQEDSLINTNGCDGADAQVFSKFRINSLQYSLESVGLYKPI